MKKPNLILAALFTFAVFAAGRVTGQEQSASAQASASIIVPISATETAQLNFGRFFPGKLGGTISISPSGQITTSSTVVTASGSINPGSFYVSGEEDATFTIALPSGPATLTNSADSKTMVVSDWVTIPEAGESGIKLAGGTQTVAIGATLKVGSLDENPKGIYTGSYEITFAYN